MERKYDLYTCSCGCLHLVPTEKIMNAIEFDKNLLLICGKCGHARLIGADKVLDNGDKAFMMYCNDFTYKDTESITESLFTIGDENIKPISEILYDKGLKIPMKTGWYATYYSNGMFVDGSAPEFYKIRNDSSKEDIIKFIETYNENRIIVDMKRFIRTTPEEYLDTISQYYIEAFDFKGTKWGQKWNK